MNEPKHEALRAARVALDHWEKVRSVVSDEDASFRLAATCADILARALGDVTALLRARVEDEDRR